MPHMSQQFSLISYSNMQLAYHLSTNLLFIKFKLAVILKCYVFVCPVKMMEYEESQ